LYCGFLISWQYLERGTTLSTPHPSNAHFTDAFKIPVWFEKQGLPPRFNGTTRQKGMSRSPGEHGVLLPCDTLLSSGLREDITPPSQIKIPLCTSLKYMGGGTGIAPLILNVGTRGEWSASRPSRFTPGKSPPPLPVSTH